VDVAYLKENKKLAEDILATGGALVSEGQMGTFPGAAESARRSRILAQSHFSPAAF
jgi:DNA processing protein